jgi:hypothetical protein
MGRPVKVTLDDPGAVEPGLLLFAAGNGLEGSQADQPARMSAHVRLAHDRGGREREGSLDLHGHSSITITLDRYGHLMPGNEDAARRHERKPRASMLSAVIALFSRPSRPQATSPFSGHLQGVRLPRDARFNPLECARMGA